MHDFPKKNICYKMPKAKDDVLALKQEIICECALFAKYLEALPQNQKGVR